MCTVCVVHFYCFFLFTRSFKTFKLKKKSSSLGINKTSESPPLLLRRHGDHYDNQSLANGQMRHTVDIGLGSNFQRGAPSRSSLQDLSSRVSTISVILSVNHSLIHLIIYKGQQFHPQ